MANWLCPLLAAHEVLLDLHSFQSAGRAFVMVGPTDNTGAVEPFAHAAQEEALVRHLGVDRAVDGWLGHLCPRRGAPARAGRRGRGHAGPEPGLWRGQPQSTCAPPAAGRSRWECGQHTDPQAPEVAWRAMRNTLAHLGLTDEPPPPPVAPIESLSLAEVVDKQHADDAFSRPWQSFDALRRPAT